MKWVLVICGLFAALPAVGLGQEPTTRPFERGPRLGLMGRRWFQSDLPDAQEWDRIRVFMKQYSPLRLQFFDSMPANWRLRPEVQAMVTKQYRGAQRAKQEDPALYDLILKRVKLEDDAFGAALDLRSAPNATEADKLKQRLRDLAGKLVDINFDERQARLDNLEKVVAEQKNKLAADKDRQKQMVDQQYDELLWRSETLHLAARAARERAAATQPTTAPSVEQKTGVAK